MHSNQGRSWVSMGNPIGERDSVKSIISDFMKASDQHDCWSAFYQINDRYLSSYIDLGFRVIKIGEEGRIKLNQFSLEGRERKSMRNTCSRIEKEGYEFSIVLKCDFHLISDQLKQISDIWLSKNEMKEKGFSVGFFDKDYLSHFDTAVLKKNGEILAFANIWQSAQQEELSVDLMRSNSNAPSGAMEYIFVQLILFGKREGYQWFNLGMAPLAGLDDSSDPRSWQSLANIAFDLGEYFYNFRGVKAFKDKFSPEWESRYIAFPQNTSLAAVMTDLIRLISKKGQNLILRVEKNLEIEKQERDEQNDKKAA